MISPECGFPSIVSAQKDGMGVMAEIASVKREHFFSITAGGCERQYLLKALRGLEALLRRQHHHPHASLLHKLLSRHALGEPRPRWHVGVRK